MSGQAQNAGAGEEPHDDPIERLHRLKRLIRIGWRFTEGSPVSASDLERQIRNGLDDLSAWAAQADVTHRLMYLTLRLQCWRS